MTIRLPIVIYSPERRVIGHAEVDGNDIRGTITDPDIAAKFIGEKDYNGFSFVPEPAVPASVEISRALVQHKIEREPNRMDFKPFVRKPFTVEAVEVTDENMAHLANVLELGKIQPKRGSEKQYIIVDKGKIPNVFRIYAGFFITKVGGKLRAYSANTFKDQFTSSSPDVQRWTRLIYNADKLREEATA